MSKRKAENEAKLSEVDIIDAIEVSGDIEIVRQCLEHGVDANVRKPFIEVGLLELALSNEQWEIASVLISNGADPNYHSEWGNNISPLEYCVRDKKMNLVAQLVSNGVDINKKFSNDESPLFEIVKACDVDSKGDFITSEQISLFKSLIEKGASVPDAFDKDQTVLHVIMDMINDEGLDILKVFVEKGADITVQNQYNQTVIDMAESYKLETIAQYLRSLGNDEADDLDGSLPHDLQIAYAQAWIFIARC